MWGRMWWARQYCSMYFWTSWWGRKLFNLGSKGKSGNIITSLGRLVLLVVKTGLAAANCSLLTKSNPDTHTPEVSVHAAVDRAAIVVCADSFIITPRAADVVGELKHHRGGKDIWAGQDVSGCTESSCPCTNHCHPQQHRPNPEEEHC